MAFRPRVDVAVAVPATGAIRACDGPGSQARVPVTLSARINATVTQLADVGDAVRQASCWPRWTTNRARRGVVSGQQSLPHRGRAALAKARADFELARSKQRRDAELLAQGFVSQAVVDTSDAALGSAAAGVDAARAALAAREADGRSLSQESRYADTVLSYSRIVAPMDGVVVQRLAEVGNTVVPGSALLKLVDPRSLWVATRVDESVVGRVQVGQPATIRLRSGEHYSGRWAHRTPIGRCHPGTRRARGLRPRAAALAIDQEAEVSIAVGEDRGIVVPLGDARPRRTPGRAGGRRCRTRFQPVETGSADARQVLVRRAWTAMARGGRSGGRGRPPARAHVPGPAH
jgi:multidrug efflux pump subunit AcrA (membrane-fusion protein)